MDSEFRIVKLLNSPVNVVSPLNPKGEYSDTAIYVLNDVVSYNGNSYIANQATMGNLPIDSNYWQVLLDPTYTLTTVVKTAAEPVSALKIVYSSSLGEVSIADPSTFATSKALGVAMNAAAIGDDVEVKTFGELKDSFFNFPQGDLLFLGSSGVITNVAPDPLLVNFSLELGYSLGVGGIFIEKKDVIEL